MPWLIGLAILVAAGWYASSKAGGISNLLHLGGGTQTTIHTVSITQQSAQGPAAQVVLAPADTLVVNVYDPPAGYAWVFSPSGLTMSGQTATGATFALQPNVMGGSINVNLFRSPNVGAVAPLASYRIGVGSTAMPSGPVM